MVHLKPCPEAGKQAALSDYGAIVSTQISYNGCVKIQGSAGSFALQITFKQICSIGGASANYSLFKDLHYCLVLSCCV